MSKTCRSVKLSNSIIAAAEPIVVKGKVRQLLLRDTVLAGFGCTVGSKAKTFYVEKAVNGRHVRATIGRFGVFTTTQARQEAIRLLGTMSRGVDPIEEKRKARAKGITLGEAWNLYLETLKTRGRSERTIKGYQYNLDAYLRDWKDTPLLNISRQDVYKKHRQIAINVSEGKYLSDSRTRSEGSGHYTANGAMRTFRAVFNRARKQHEELPECPTINVDFFKESRRTTILKNEDLPTWYCDIVAIDNPIQKDYLLFTLFTGLRRQNAAEIQWAHVNFDNKSLHIPLPKSRIPFDLPLSDYLINMLMVRKKENEIYYPASPFVFPANSKIGYIRQPQNHKSTIKFAMHDLRRTFITVAESLDLSAYSIKFLVNHSVQSSDITGGYVIPDVERLRKPMQLITDRLVELCGVDGGDGS